MVRAPTSWPGSAVATLPGPGNTTLRYRVRLTLGPARIFRAASSPATQRPWALLQLACLGPAPVARSTVARRPPAPPMSCDPENRPRAGFVVINLRSQRTTSCANLVRGARLAGLRFPSSAVAFAAISLSRCATRGAPATSELCRASEAAAFHWPQRLPGRRRRGFRANDPALGRLRRSNARDRARKLAAKSRRRAKGPTMRAGLAQRAR